MKKKIKDLTLEECQRICDTHVCKNCPLKIQHPDDDDLLGCPVSYDDWYLEKEVEINESDND